MGHKSPENHRIFIEIPARGGSKGLHRKALQMLGEYPLIAYTIRDAHLIPGDTKIFVNTDDAEIGSVSISHAAEVPFLRPEELARDNSNLSDAHKYALAWYQYNEGYVPDIEIVMSPTHPFRRKSLIKNALKIGFENPDIFNIGSISPVKVINSNFWIKKDGNMRRFQITNSYKSRLGTFYQSAFSFNIVFSYRSNLPDRRVPIVLNEIESIDIDEPIDIEIARMVISKGLYPFYE
jgi:N-acylneuraminate cytidylyltransferase